MRRSGPSRRSFLQSLGAGSLVGLTGCNSSTDEPATVTETAAPTASSTPTPTATESATPPETSTATETAANSWPMYLSDSLNSQTNHTTTGPREAVSPSWAFETDGEVRSSPAVVDETLYVGSTDGQLYALNIETGERRWTFETGGPILSSPAVVDGTVYIGSNDNVVYALAAATGKERWVFETGGPVRSSPTVVKNAIPTADVPAWRDQGILAVGSDDGNVYVLTAETGEEKYALSTDGPVVSTPNIATYLSQSGEQVLWFEVGSTDGHYYGNEPTPRGRESDQAYEYDYDSEVGAPIYSSITADYSHVNGAYPWWFGADDGVLRRRKSYVAGGREWDFETGDRIRSSPALAGGTVYCGSWDHFVYAVGADDGEEEWRFETGRKVESSPAVADGTLYVGSADQSVYALDAESGENLWAFETGGEVASSPAVVDGTVYVGSDDGSVYALSES